METQNMKRQEEDSGFGLASTSSPSCISDNSSDDSSSEKLLSYPFTGSAEDAFIQSGLNLITVSELTQAVEKCKEMVLNTKEYSEERKWLVRYLIELRYRLEEAREAELEHRKLKPIGTPEYSPSKVSSALAENVESKARDKRIVLGHHFVLQSSNSNILKCDRCCRNIWGLLHFWYQCVDCQYKCHVRCLEKIMRLCAFVRVCETPFYSTEICPEIGLAAQGYRCHECKSLISYKNCWCEPRQCDYDGRYYCSNCHWDSLSVIPARVIHNWDFTERKVCCSCYQFLQMMMARPVINLDTLNPQLFQFVVDLATVKKLRSQFLLIKQYLTTCPDGLREKNKKQFIWSLNSHFIENSPGIFSMLDLISVHKETILPVLRDATNVSTDHIKNCSMCKGKGYICELCFPKKQQVKVDVLFPFDDVVYVYVCGKCSAVFHRHCWMKKNLSLCPRCDRIQQRQCLQQESFNE